MRWIAIAIFIAAACLVWLPVQVQNTLDGTLPDNPVPAGEIQKDFLILQQVDPDPEALPEAGKIHPHCVGIRFATYMRRNSGRLAVELRQGPIERRWQVRAARLADNSFRYFCPGRGFSAGKPFQLRVSGVNGKPGSSATVWLTEDTRLGALESDNPAIAGMSLTLDLVQNRQVSLAEAIRVNRGAFFFGWLCTLMVAVIVITRCFSRAAQR